jgi:hypothetical protein
VVKVSPDVIEESLPGTFRGGLLFALALAARQDDIASPGAAVPHLPGSGRSGFSVLGQGYSIAFNIASLAGAVGLASQ